MRRQTTTDGPLSGCSLPGPVPTTRIRSLMARSLVIVESATKAPTINRYLGRDFVVKSSAGHVRDLPTRRSVLDPKERAQQRAKEAAKTRKLTPKRREEYRRQRARSQLVRNMGVDPDKGWTATYEVIPGKDKVVRELQALANRSDLVYLATDLDREGEAIAWHLTEVLGGPPGSLPAGGVQPDYERRRRGSVREPRPDRREPRQRPAGAPLSGSGGRLRTVAVAVVEGGAGSVRRTRPVGRGAVGGGARARDPGVHARRVLGSVRGSPPRRSARQGRLAGAFPGRQGERQGLPSHQPSRRGGGRCSLARSIVLGARPGGKEHHDPAAAAVHHLDPAAGGFRALGIQRPPDDDRRPAALRGGPHHLYAHRLHEHRPGSGGGRAGAYRQGVRQALPAGVAERLRQQIDRPGGARGDQADGARRHRALGGNRCRRAASLRSDLASIRRLPDEPGGVPGNHRHRGRGRVRTRPTWTNRPF